MAISRVPKSCTRAEALSGRVTLRDRLGGAAAAGSRCPPAAHGARCAAQPPGPGAVDGPPEAGGEREARTQGRRPVCGGPEARAGGAWREAAGGGAAYAAAEPGPAPPSLRAEDGAPFGQRMKKVGVGEADWAGPRVSERGRELRGRGQVGRSTRCVCVSPFETSLFIDKLILKLFPKLMALSTSKDCFCTQTNTCIRHEMQQNNIPYVILS